MSQTESSPELLPAWHLLPEDHPTPSLVVDRRIAQRNIDRMQAYCASYSLRLRPHTKTHKSVRMASAQLDAGATGLTVAKLGEAEVMGRVCDDLFVAYPAVGTKRLQLLGALAREKRVAVGLDSAAAIDQVQEAARTAGASLGVLVDLDVGFHRTGVADPQKALELARRIAAAKHLEFRGIMCFPGNLTPQSEDSAWESYSDAIRAVLDALASENIPVETVSGGSTPTSRLSHRNPWVNEIRPGTYVYNDLNEVRLGVASLEDCAARIVATVISVPSRSKFVVDAGSKTLSSDRNCVDPESGFGLVAEFPEARISRLSEEHGEIVLPSAAPHSVPKVGDRVTIIPNHICVCVNLQDTFTLWDGSSAELLPVDARGRLV